MTAANSSIASNRREDAVEDSPIARLSCAALGVGGITGAAFVIISRGEVTGALAMLSRRWMLAHNLHFISAALLLFGVVGLYLAHSHRLEVGGHFAFVLALLGTAFYFAGGVITAAVLPWVAGTAPNVVAANGPLFNPPLPVLIVSLAVFSLGWIALGVVVARRGIFPPWMGWTIAAGALIQAVPPRPFGSVPWLVMDAGWLIMALGLVGIAVHGWRSASTRAIQANVGLASGD
jgi:hypothetical protein